MGRILGHPVEAADLRTLRVGSRVAVRGHDHRQRVVVRPVHARVGEAAFGAVGEEVERLRAEAHHQDLTLGVAEADVVFDETRAAVRNHETRVEDALVGCAAPGHFGDRGPHDLLHGAGGDGVGEDGGGGVGAHSSGVGARVPFSHPLVVLRGADGQAVGAVAEDEEGGFLSVHEFLDHHLGARRAEGAAEHVVDGGLGLGEGRGHDDALAGGEAVGLHDDGGALLADPGAGGGGVPKTRPGGSGDAGRVADFLGEAFGRLEPGGRLARAEDEEAGFAQAVRDAGGEGRLGADDDEVDGVLLGEGDERRAVQDVDVGAFGDHRDTGVAGRHDEPVAFGVLEHGPGQRMLPPAAAEDEDVHGALRALGSG